MTDDPKVTPSEAPGAAEADDETAGVPARDASVSLAPDRGWRWTRERIAWLVGMVALIVIAGVVAFAIGGASRDGTVDDLNGQLGVLGDAANAAVRIAAEPDAKHVVLAPELKGDRPAGEIVYAAGSGRLLVVATGLAPEPAGYDYALFVGGSQPSRLIAHTTWAGGSWSWTGIVDALAGSIGPDTYFGVALVPTGGTDIGSPVLTGRP